MGPVAPLQLAIRPSVTLTAFLLFGHSLALAALVLLSLAPYLFWGAATALLLSWAFHGWRLWRPFVVGLRTEAGACLCWQGRDGAWQEAIVMEQSVVLSWLIVLRLRVKGRRLAMSLVLPVDALGVESHRLLRRWLLWASQSPGAKQGGEA